MIVVANILLILAVVCFLADAFGWPASARVKLTPLGLALFVLNALVAIVPR
jgi:hypothetical protein